MNYKQNYKPNKKSRVKKPLIVSIIILVLIGSGFFAYKYFWQKKNSITTYSPPTQEEKQSGDKVKSEIFNQEQENAQKKDDSTQAQNNQTNNLDSVAEVIITDAAQYDDIVEVRAFVANKYQDGTCKITLTKDSLVVNKETKAYKDATTTICTNPLINKSEFKQTGDWQVIVEYTSSTATGKSNPQTVKIE